MSEIQLTGLAAGDPVPGIYQQLNFAQGPASAASSVYPAILMGNMLSTGSATVANVYGPATALPMLSESDAIALFGAGSELHVMWRAFVQINKTTPLYAVPNTESTGAKASGTITVTGSASAACTIRVWVGSTFVDTPVNLGDSPTTIAANIVLSINSVTYWPANATSSAGVVTVTAKQKGPRGNLIRIQSAVLPNGSFGCSVAPTVPTNMTGGTTADSYTSAIAAIGNTRYYYTASAANDSTNFGALVAMVNANAVPTVGIRERIVCASTDTGANTITMATTANAPRAECVWSQNNDYLPCEIAAHNTAVYALVEASAVPRQNLSGYGKTAATAANWKIPAPRDGTAPTRAQIFAALNNGVTPIGVNANGSTYLVKRITTYSLNGSTPDYRCRDANKVLVMDLYADQADALVGGLIDGATIGDDPPPGGFANTAPNVVSPRAVRNVLTNLTNQFAANGLVQHPAAVNANTVVQRSGVNNNRFSARVPQQPADILDQVAIEEDQVG